MNPFNEVTRENLLELVGVEGANFFFTDGSQKLTHRVVDVGENMIFFRVRDASNVFYERIEDLKGVAWKRVEERTLGTTR